MSMLSEKELSFELIQVFIQYALFLSQNQSIQTQPKPTYTDSAYKILQHIGVLES